EEMEKEEEEIIKSINETPTQKAAKRRGLREQAKENEDLKKQLEVVVDEDDDVFIEATPIGRKVPVVNYKIVMINNKPRYKIIRADDTHQLYTSFITHTMFALLVEKKYPLSRFTLEQLVNVLLELMLLKRSKENTKCVSAAGEELTAAKHKLELKLFRDAAAAARMK
nr:hypothetical protein [Tanacetum cinerariifolium]